MWKDKDMKKTMCVCNVVRAYASSENHDDDLFDDQSR